MSYGPLTLYVLTNWRTKIEKTHSCLRENVYYIFSYNNKIVTIACTVWTTTQVKCYKINESENWYFMILLCKEISGWLRIRLRNKPLSFSLSKSMPSPYLSNFHAGLKQSRKRIVTAEVICEQWQWCAGNLYIYICLLHVVRKDLSTKFLLFSE